MTCSWTPTGRLRRADDAALAEVAARMSAARGRWRRDPPASVFLTYRRRDAPTVAATPTTANSAIAPATSAVFARRVRFLASANRDMVARLRWAGESRLKLMLRLR